MTAATPTSVLQIRDLSVAADRADGPRVIDSVSLDVRAGEMMCVVGESGSGKSVTSLAIMGLLPKGSLCPAGGSILLEGEEILGAGERRLDALRTTSMAIARIRESSRASGPARTVRDRTVRMMCSTWRVLKNSMDSSERCTSAKYCSSCASVAGGASLRGGAMARVASPAVRWSSESTA